jgi:phage terminase small subunit
MPRRSPYDVAFSTSTEPRLTPPPDLDADARQVFIDTVTSVRAGHFTAAHLPLLSAYADAVVLRQRASKGLREDGYVLRDGKASPWLPHLTLASRQLTILARALRLSPASQHAPAPKEPALPVSAYEKMALEAASNGRN